MTWQPVTAALSSTTPFAMLRDVHPAIQDVSLSGQTRHFPPETRSLGFVVRASSDH